MSLTDAQKRIRRLGVGSSEVAAVLGFPAFLSPIDVWRAKVEGHEQEGSEMMEIGTLLEDDILELLQRREGVACVPMTTLLHPSLPLVATPDALAFRDGKLFCAVEAKSAQPFAREWDVDLTDGAPKPYVLQAMTHLLVLRANGYRVSTCLLPVLKGGFDFRVFKVEWDQAVADGICEGVQRWWGAYVETKTPPPPDGTPSYTAWLEATFPGPQRGPEVEAPEACRGLALEYLSAKQRADAAETEMRTAQQQLQAAMGEAECMTGPGFVATWRCDKNGKRRFLLKERA